MARDGPTEIDCQHRKDALKYEHCNSQVIVESTIPGSPLCRWVVSVGVSTSSGSTCCGKHNAARPSIRPTIADTAKLGIMFAANQ